MKFFNKNLITHLVSMIVLVLFIFFLLNNLLKKPYEIINFLDSEISKDFEIELSNNLNNFNEYISKYLFVESYSLKRINNEINIKINLKKHFAINNFTNELIFYDNTIAPLQYFKPSYLENINLIDISKNSIHLNKYLSDNYQKLSSIFNIDQIEYIDSRRYNLVLSSGKIVMLPKVIDSKFVFFIQNNIDLIEKTANYKEFLDLRNFHNKTIRLK